MARTIQVTPRKSPEKTKRHLRKERRAARLNKTTRQPHPETIKRRNRKTLAAQLAVMPFCPIKREDIAEKDRIFVSQSNLIPGKPHAATLGRWMKFGVQLRPDSPARLKLPAFRSGSRRWTSLRQFAWWQEQIDNADAS